MPDRPVYVDFGYILSGNGYGSFNHTWTHLPTQGCTSDFWQGGPNKPDAMAGDALLWAGDCEVPGAMYSCHLHVDAQWLASGGNPYIHTTLFNDYFEGAPGPYTIFELVMTPPSLNFTHFWMPQTTTSATQMANARSAPVGGNPNLTFR